MLKIIEAYGIPEIIIQTIALTYKDTFAKVTSPDGDTELFEIIKGVLQCNTLAPFLFVITLDYAMRHAIDGHEEEFVFEVMTKSTKDKAEASQQHTLHISATQITSKEVANMVYI